MKAIQPVILGLFGGLAVSLALLAGLYFSPLREPAYFAVDPEMAQVRAKLSGYREWINQADLNLAAHEDQGSDSLRAAQTVAWREYKKWRTHLGELARSHAKPTAEGIGPWLYSLRYYAVPGTAIIAIVPALLIAWRGRNRFSTARNQGRKTMTSGGRAGNAPVSVGAEAGTRRGEARAQALANFADAVKKAQRVEPPTEPIAMMAGEDIFEPPTEHIPVQAYSENAGVLTPEIPETQMREPETRPIELAREDGNETMFMQDLPPWGGNRSQQGEEKAPSLAMEDEDDSEAETLGIMPPTTEVERIERRKDEVLKLARKGMTSSEISRRMRISQDQVEFIIRLRREKG